ncbi:MAG TPA: response regulator transcription factor [Thermohalobaculum sp.]|nr:response regulator transcription factor [Thermohalobaculum sp.]
MGASPGASEAHFRVLVVDDDEALGAELEEFLREAGFEVGRATDVPSARRLAASLKPDICIVDIVMPGTTGKVFCREIAEGSDAGVIMMSSLSDTETVISLLGIGADDYIVKPFQFAELVARIAAVLRRRQTPGAAAQGPVMRVGPWEFHPSERRLKGADGRSVALTPGEIEVLRFLAASPGIVFGREDLLAVSRNRQHGGSMDRSVDNLIKRLRRKIEPDPENPTCIVTVWGKGYRFDG